MSDDAEKLDLERIKADTVKALADAEEYMNAGVVRQRVRTMCEHAKALVAEVEDLRAERADTDSYVKDLEAMHATVCTDRDGYQMTSELKAEVERLRALIDIDRTGLASALNAVRRHIAGWAWMPNGEWASYDWAQRAEETLRKEIGDCFDAIEKTASDALTESGANADMAFRPQREQHEVARLRGEVERLRAAAKLALAEMDYDYEPDRHDVETAAQKALRVALKVK